MTTVHHIDIMDSLRAFTGHVDDFVLLLGYYDPYDGGGGYFFWDPASIAGDNGGSVIMPTGQSQADPGRWVRTSPELSTRTNGNTGLISPRLFEINVRQFGAGNGDTSGRTDTCAIQTAIDSVPVIGTARIVIPPGNYYITNIHISRGIILEGVGEASGRGDVTLYVVEGHGLIVDSIMGLSGQFTRWVDSTTPPSTWGNSTSCFAAPGSYSSGQGAIIRNLQIYKARFATQTQDGIRVYASCKITDITISEMQGNGITIASLDFPSIGLTNASEWYIERVFVNGCAHDGLHVRGDVSGNGLCLQFKASGNKCYGIRDEGGVGNTYVGTSAEQNAYGFHAINPNAPHTFIGCHWEGPEDPAKILFDGGPSLIVGGHLSGALEGSRVSHYKSRLAYHDEGGNGTFNLDIPRGDLDSAFRFAYHQHGIPMEVKAGDWYLKRLVDIEPNSGLEHPASEFNPYTWGHQAGVPSRCWGFFYKDPGWRPATPVGTMPIGWTDEYHPRGVAHPFFQKALLNQRGVFSKRVSVTLSPQDDIVVDFLWSDWLIPEPGASISASFAIEYSDEVSLRSSNVRIMGYTLATDPSNPQTHNLCKVRLRDERVPLENLEPLTCVLVGHFETFKLWRDGDPEGIAVL
ncbi:MAG: right-handed parallel beta-helix repeat-containing protein [Anaerolineae bacterium]|nr:right-handed parallel beta-helix repeat-containing protein [Anaerolineae bacterium]